MCHFNAERVILLAAALRFATSRLAATPRQTLEISFVAEICRL
jgi:hypothetical protein